MKLFCRAPLALLLAMLLLTATACSGSQSSSAVPSQSSSETASSSTAPSSSEPTPSSSAPSSSEASASSEEPTQPPKETESSKAPEAVETIGGTVADLTGSVTGEIEREIAGISGSRAGTAAERDSLAALLTSLKPEKVSQIIIGDPLSGYADQMLLSDEDAKTLVGLVSALPAPAVFETLGNPTTGGFLWMLYLETEGKELILSDDGTWLRASIKGNSQLLVFDSAPCKGATEKLSAFLSTQITAAQGNILTLS